jgi:glycosyltransferase involved in cell wall biosynthesis
MNISLLSAEYPPRPGGVGDYTRWLGNALVERGHNVSILTIYDLRFTIYDLSQHKAHPKSKIQNLKSDWNWRCWPAVIAALDQLRPDVLHIQYQTGAYGMHPAINLLPWRLRQLPTRPKIIVTAHDLLLPYLFPKAGPLRRWVTHRLLADADGVVVTNEEDYARLRGKPGNRETGKPGDQETGRLGDTNTQDATHFTQDARRNTFHVSRFSRSLSNITLIPIGSNIPVEPPPDFNRAAWRSQLGITENDILIAYFGLFSRNKGIDVLLRALMRLPDSMRLLIIGGAATAPEDRAFAVEARRQIETQGLSHRVIITGHCSETHVSAHLLAADLTALPFADGASFRRGSLLAALAHAVPVVTTGDERRTTNDERRTINDEELRNTQQLADEVNVVFVRPSDDTALAAALMRLSKDAELRKRLGDAGMQLAAHFSWDSIAAQHEAFYRKMK